MKKLSFVGFVAAVLLLCSSCVRPQWYLLNSEGIASYNRHTGQFEILWTHHSESVGTQTDSTNVGKPAKK